MRIVQHNQLHSYTELDYILLDACTSWDLEEIKQCMADGANINCLDKDGLSVLTRAIHNLPYREHYVRGGMTEEEVNGVIERDYKKCISTIDLLLEYGADIDLYGYQGEPPLVPACREGHIPIALYLLERGANYHLPISLIRNETHCNMAVKVEDVINELSSTKYINNENAKVLKEMIYGLYCIG
jgi:ankyrin repeat protein